MAAQPDGPSVAVGLVGSAGGVDAIGRVLGGLRADLAAAVIVVLHLMPDRRSLLAELLDRRSDLAVKQAEDGDVLEDGCVYVAPPDAHLVVTSDHRLHLDTGPPVHHARPAADILLASMAGAYGQSCVAVVLTGAGTDGAAGARAVKTAGGRVIAQDEISSEYFGMPGAAIATGMVDRIIPLGEIAEAISEFVEETHASGVA